MPSRASSCMPTWLFSIRGMAGRWGRPISALDPLQPLRDMAQKIFKNKLLWVVDIRTPIHYAPCRSCVAVRGAGSTSSLTTEERPNCFGKNARMHVARPRVRSVGSCLAEMASTDPCMPATGELNNSPPRRITQRLKPFADFGHMVQNSSASRVIFGWLVALIEHWGSLPLTPVLYERRALRRHPACAVLRRTHHEQHINT